MNLDLHGKIIVVTGGASGIGRAIAAMAADEGAISCILDRNEETLGKTKAEIEEKGGKIFVEKTELLDPDSCKNAIDRILLKYGRIDSLVNNAGLNDGVGLENGNEKSFLESLKINAGHYFEMTALALPALKKTGGTIVNICSKTAETGQGGTSGYAAGNGVRMGLTNEWARDLAPFGIRTNAVVVAECWTPQYEWWISQLSDPVSKMKTIIRKIPFENRMTSPDEVASTVVFLCSGKSANLNGQFIYVDGGYVHLDRGIA